MFTHSIKLEVKGANDRIYRFICDPESPLGEIHDVLHTMSSVVLREMQQQHEQESNPEESLENTDEE